MEGSERTLVLRPQLPAVLQRKLAEDGRTRAGRQLAACSTAEARRCLPYAHAERLCVLPLAIHRGRDGHAVLALLAASAADPAVLAELRWLAGVDISLDESGEPEALRLAIAAAYRGDSQPLSSAADAARASVAASGTDAELAETLRRAAAQPIPQLLEALLVRAHYLTASDLHLEPQGGEARVRYRVDGRLREETAVRLSAAAHENLARHLKVLCELDLTERRRPQDGSFSIRLPETELRLRVAFLPQGASERVVMRIFSTEKERPRTHSGFVGELAGLGMSREEQHTLLLHLGLPGGSLLFSGPTGSGKTTLLYSCLEHLNEEWRSVVTVEDPIERVVPGLNQTQVSSGLGFRAALPALLRQDPDVLMLGEIRDGETAETALTASITGHLLLSTVHAGSCFEIVPRLISLGVSGLLLGSSLRLLASQRLLGRNCSECREPVRVSPGIAKLFGLESGSSCVHAPGCRSCGGTGISGRCGVFELLPITPALQEILYGMASPEQAGRLLAALKERAREEGFRPLAYRIRDAMLSGDVSPATACRALGFEPRIFEGG